MMPSLALRRPRRYGLLGGLRRPKRSPVRLCGVFGVNSDAAKLRTMLGGAVS